MTSIECPRTLRVFARNFMIFMVFSSMFVAVSFHVQEKYSFKQALRGLSACIPSLEFEQNMQQRIDEWKESMYQVDAPCSLPNPCEPNPCKYANTECKIIDQEKGTFKCPCQDGYTVRKDFLGHHWLPQQHACVKVKKPPTEEEIMTEKIEIAKEDLSEVISGKKSWNSMTEGEKEIVVNVVKDQIFPASISSQFTVSNLDAFSIDEVSKQKLSIELTFSGVNLNTALQDEVKKNVADTFGIDIGYIYIQWTFARRRRLSATGGTVSGTVSVTSIPFDLNNDDEGKWIGLPDSDRTMIKTYLRDNIVPNAIIIKGNFGSAKPSFGPTTINRMTFYHDGSVSQSSSYDSAMKDCVTRIFSGVTTGDITITWDVTRGKGGVAGQAYVDLRW